MKIVSDRSRVVKVLVSLSVRELNVTEQCKQDGRRLEVVASRGCQLALAEKVDGVAFQAARRRKELTYPELHGNSGRTRLVVMAV